MKLNRDIRIVKRPDKLLVFSAEGGDLFETNETGEFIINCIQKGKEKCEIIELLHKETKQDKKVIEKDLENFIVALKEKSVLR